MIKSINIQGYKNLSGLNITQFSKINLFSGKNNVGKTSLLEAIELLITEAGLRDILRTRGEEVPYLAEDMADLERYNINAISSIFANRDISVSSKNEIYIKDGNTNVSIKLVYYDEYREEDGSVRRSILKSKGILGDKLALAIYRNNNSLGRLFPMNGYLTFKSYIEPFKNKEFKGIIALDPYISKDDFIIAKLWDQLVLSGKESIVVDVMNEIDSSIEDIAFIASNLNRKDTGRKPFVKLENQDQKVPIKSMGDGVCHLFSTLLALVASENGCLLIDEIDNGLHYSVQKKLWNIIFNLSKKLNVQVFATTHSSDCISSFGSVLAEGNNAVEGSYFRMEKKNDKIRAVPYNADELKIVAAQNIEVR